MFRSSCLVCGSKNLKQIIDLGSHPFADTFIPNTQLSEADKIYPLICDLCIACGQVQSKCETSPDDRYAQHDYSYTSSNSEFSRNHWDEYALTISKNLNRNSFVVEIGSNDGYLAEQFLKKNHKVIGVDPSPYMAELAKKRNIETIVSLFGKKVSELIIEKYGKADLIIANNVFNHSDNPLEFVQAVSELLAPNGKFVFELPYWKISVESKKFDQIYHEHVSYFTVKSSKSILNKAGLSIISINIVDYHGGSLRVTAQKGKLECSETNKMIADEIVSGLFKPETYSLFMGNVLSRRNNFLQKIYEIKSKGYPIIAVGAAAKGNTFLNFYNLDHSILYFVTDSSPHKQGKFTPATRIPICGDDIFSKYDEVYALILSWNISDRLKKILLSINPKIIFLEP